MCVYVSVRASLSLLSDAMCGVWGALCDVCCVVCGLACDFVKASPKQPHDFKRRARVAPRSLAHAVHRLTLKHKGREA